jgi:hypothetical protein
VGYFGVKRWTTDLQDSSAFGFFPTTFLECGKNDFSFQLIRGYPNNFLDAQL